MTDQISMWTPEVTEYVVPSMEEVRAGEGNGLVAVGSFSGCGGSSLGMKMAGWEVRAAIEFIPAAADTYRANFPDTHLFERDIRKVEASEILAAIGLAYGELDCFEGSPPCASFSSAGMGESGWGTVKKYSDSEQRTDDLFWEWARLLKGMNPRSFIAENVPGMLTGAALEEYAYKITADLSELGYNVTSKVLNAAAYGVPQERRRLIFMGIRRDLGVHPSFPPPLGAEPVSVEQALASVAADDSDHAPYLEGSMMAGKAVGRTWEWLRAKRDAKTDAERAAAKAIKDNCARCGEPLAGHVERMTEVGAVKKSKDQEGARRTKMVRFCADGEKAIEVKDYFLLTLPDPKKPCPTLTATGAQNGAASVVHPTECRKFTPAEAKALCSFPADFELTGTREQRYERMGRSVMPLFYRAVTAHLAELLWRCEECGSSEGRYDGGDACETCVMRSFAESG